MQENYANNVGDILYMINDRITFRNWEEFLVFAFADDEGTGG